MVVAGVLVKVVMVATMAVVAAMVVAHLEAATQGAALATVQVWMACLVVVEALAVAA